MDVHHLMLLIIGIVIFLVVLNVVADGNATLTAMKYRNIYFKKIKDRNLSYNEYSNKVNKYYELQDKIIKRFTMNRINNLKRKVILFLPVLLLGLLFLI